MSKLLGGPPTRPGHPGFAEMLVPEGPPGGPDVERDFYAHLYSGDMTALESGANIQEDYYNYLDSWYRAQKGLVSPTTSNSSKGGTGGSATGVGQSTIYIPVDALQNLRASMPALVTCAAASSTNSVSRQEPLKKWTDKLKNTLFEKLA